MSELPPAPDPPADLQSTKHLVDTCARLALAVSVDEARRLVREFDHMDGLMPILDPTGYRQVMRNLPGHRRVAEAFLAFRQVLQEEVTRG